MTRSKQITPILVAGLSLLALPALAQSSGSTPGVSPDPDRPASSSTSGSSVSSPSSSQSDSTLTTPRSSSTTGNTQGSGVGWINSNFTQVDKDSDGKISQQEFTEAGQSQSGVSGSSSVTPRSGGVSGVSGGQYSAEQFRQFDKDHDGYLTRDELNASGNSSSMSDDSSSGSTRP